MKKAITFILVLLLCVPLGAQSNYSTLTGAKLLYNYFIDFISGGTVGTSNYSAQTGQKKFQDQFIDFLKWADSVNTGLTSLQISDLTVTDTAYIGTLISDTILVGITKLDENLDANQKMIINLSALKTGKVDLKNQTAVESTIGTDTTRIYPYDDGSSVRLVATKDDSATEATAYLAELSDVANLATKAGSPSYWFDGDNDFISLGTSTNLDLGTGNGTYIAQIKNTGNDGANNMIFVVYDATTKDEQAFYIHSTGLLQGQIRENNTVKVVAGTTDIGADSKEHSVAFSIDRSSATGLKLYIDGIQEKYSTQEDPTSLTGSIASTGTKYIGIDQNVTSYPFAGNIPRFLFFNLILTQAEIQQIQQSGQIPYEYQGASQTAIYTSDFSAGVDGWDAFNSWNSMSAANGYLVCSASAAEQGCRRDAALLTAGKRYRISYTATDITGAPKFKDNSNTANYNIQTGSNTYEFTLGCNSNGYVYIAAGTDSDTLKIKDIVITQLGNVLDLNPNGIGNTQWTDASGNNLNGAVSGAVANNLPPNHLDRYSTGTFTTNIASGEGTKVIVIPAYYYVESITIDDKGTAAGLSDIVATQETSSITLISGKSVATGNKLTFKTIADHNVYTTNKNLSFTATGNGNSGMEIIVNFRRQR